jgi:DNA invertase Pin-like site-specific DNA recombinase
MSNVYLYQTSDMEITAQNELEHYVKQKGFKGHKAITEAHPIQSNWQERSLGKLLKNATTGDIIIMYDAIQCARSANQMLDLLLHLIDRGITIHFVKYAMQYTGKAQYKVAELIGLLHKIEADYVSRRNIEAIERRRNMGVILGRPKGRKNKALKLDKFKKEITRYLELSISKASIAKLVNCHPQTLYDWIERNSIPDRRPRKPRTRKLEDA